MVHVLLNHRSEQRQKALFQALFPSADAHTAHRAWFRTKVRQLVKDHTLKLSGMPCVKVDVVGNVVNLVPVYWVAHYIVRRDSFSGVRLGSKVSEC